MSLKIAPIQSKLINNAVVLTGAPRSGTTILGKLISSFDNLEYHFEPPSLYMITSAFASGDLPLDVAARLLTVYLSEDLLLESAHGRKVNLRPNDDSQIFNSMTWSELNERWNSIKNRDDAIKHVKTQRLRLAVKMPNIFDALPLIRKIVQNMHLIVSVRNGADVVRSIIRKGWVTDKGLENDLWPYVENTSAVNTPYWVTEEYIERWPSMNEETRACLMWSHHAELGLAATAHKDDQTSLHMVRYEELIKNANDVVEKLANALDCKTTIHTIRWIKSIYPPDSKRRGARLEYRARVDKDVLDYFERINSKWGY